MFTATNLQKKHRISSFLSKNALINEHYRFIASINSHRGLRKKLKSTMPKNLLKPEEN